MPNQTCDRFGYPRTLIRDYEHWTVLLREQQITLGSLVLCAKSEATAFSELPADAFAEMATVTADVERSLKAAVHYEKINYLMLMMVDPHVHFHVFPRYEGQRSARLGPRRHHPLWARRAPDPNGPSSAEPLRDVVCDVGGLS